MSALPNGLASGSWYIVFNAAEGLLWMTVALAIWIRCPVENRQQLWAVRLGSLAFAVFGVTDWMECSFEGRIPPWLWCLKVACGAAILAARYTWRGWNSFRFRDREVLFAMFCLIAVAGLMWLQAVVK